ncbi:hypothetical protein GA0115239_101346 [Streptomyces sp. BpilaLS-43]|nr:hypothetical protein GA0115239_101346 [Streptomyces sp. BpilaLS-43]
MTPPAAIAVRTPARSRAGVRPARGGHGSTAVSGSAGSAGQPVGRRLGCSCSLVTELSYLKQVLCAGMDARFR